MFKVPFPDNSFNSCLNGDQTIREYLRVVLNGSHKVKPFPEGCFCKDRKIHIAKILSSVLYLKTEIYIFKLNNIFMFSKHNFYPYLNNSSFSLPDLIFLKSKSVHIIVYVGTHIFKSGLFAAQTE